MVGMQGHYKVELFWKLQLNREENKVKRASKEKKGNKGSGIVRIEVDHYIWWEWPMWKLRRLFCSFAQESIRILGALVESGLLSGEGAVG